MKTLTTSLFIVGAALAVSACAGNDGSPYFASGRTASYGDQHAVTMEKAPMAEPSAVRSERVFKATQAK